MSIAYNVSYWSIAIEKGKIYFWSINHRRLVQ